jgi:hypothetical protein
MFMQHRLIVIQERPKPIAEVIELFVRFVAKLRFDRLARSVCSGAEEIQGVTLYEHAGKPAIWVPQDRGIRCVGEDLYGGSTHA